MSLLKKLVFCVFVTILCGVSPNARAEILIDFSIDDGVTFGKSFEIEEGSVTTIGLFLSQTGSTSVLSDEWLLGFGLAGTLDGGSLGEITSVTNNPVFDFETIERFTSSTITMEAAAFNNVAPTGPSIFLGEFDFTSIGFGQSTFQFSDRTPGSGSANASWLSGTGTELDEQIFGGGSPNRFGLTLTTTAVPEPNSLSLMFLGVSTLAFHRPRRRRAID